MQTDALSLAQEHNDNSLSERLSFAKIELQVTNLERALTFWTDILGLTVRNKDNNKVELGTQTTTLFVLHAGATKTVAAPYTGMYHVAIGLPSQEEFSRILARLLNLKIPVSVVDHLMSKAIYLKDPDGIEIEFAFETPERFGRFGDMSQGLILYDANGKPHSGRAGLDIPKELDHAIGLEVSSPLSEGTVIAHLHFKVGELESAATWFEGLGFARNLMIPNFGFADLGAGAKYTHRIAMNIWSGTNLPPTPSDMAGLIHYTLLAHSPSILQSAQNMTETQEGLTGLDPTGIKVSILPIEISNIGVH